MRKDIRNISQTSPTVYVLLSEVDDNRLKAVRNTARKMIMALYSRRQMSVKVFAENVLRRNSAAQLQRQRLNAWTSSHIEDEILAIMLPNVGVSKSARTKSLLKQLQADAK